MRVLWSAKFLSTALVTSLLYFLLAGLGMNWGLLRGVWFGSYPMTFKLNLSWALIQGLFSTVDPVHVGVMILIAILTGMNLGLLVVNWSQRGGMRSLFGSGLGSFLGVATAGCMHCGLPIISVLGLVGSLSFIPFSGDFVSIVSIGLLITAFSYSVIQLRRPVVCNINV